MIGRGGGVDCRVAETEAVGALEPTAGARLGVVVISLPLHFKAK
jgi:hypothetical protein